MKITKRDFYLNRGQYTAIFPSLKIVEQILKNQEISDFILKLAPELFIEGCLDASKFRQLQEDAEKWNETNEWFKGQSKEDFESWKIVGRLKKLKDHPDSNISSLVKEILGEKI